MRERSLLEDKGMLQRSWKRCSRALMLLGPRQLTLLLHAPERQDDVVSRRLV